MRRSPEGGSQQGIAVAGFFRRRGLYGTMIKQRDLTVYREMLSQLEEEHHLSRKAYEELIGYRWSLSSPDKYDLAVELDQDLFKRAVRCRERIFGNRIYMRGLIEFTNYCRNDCYYCGIRRENSNIKRYRLSREQILACCDSGYRLGYRTFVLQGGEDAYFTDDRICDIVSTIKKRYSDCAVTLSIGERSRESYIRYFQAGADRYLLRHETADERHYQYLHPASQSLIYRKECLRMLKEIGYQVGAGFMVDSPGQTIENLAEDLEYLWTLQPHMIGIGPFISHQDTPFCNEPNGVAEHTLFLLGILRLMFPCALLPATTALGTLAEDGRMRGILAGANVIMPNLSPREIRAHYSLYDNKCCTGEESAECTSLIQGRMQAIGVQLVVDRGDYPRTL